MKNDKVAILTNFMEFNPGYSLTGIVADQCKMLQSHGHKIQLFVNSEFNDLDSKNQFSLDCSKEVNPVNLERLIPFTHLIDYTSIRDLSNDHKKIIQDTAEMLVENLKDVPYVFTHDFIFTGWFLPYGLACIEAAKHLPNTTFLHWIHSIPSTVRDWWTINTWGKNHQLIFPNKTETVRVAEQYRTFPNRVSCIPHIKDLRTWYDFDRNTIDFVDEHPAVMTADIVQIYPASTDRLESKRIDNLIQIFSAFKKQGRSICLTIANQWATGRQRKEDVNTYYEKAQLAGLRKDEEFIFTSEWRDEFATGIPKIFLRNLMNCGNLFIFPTREESFGLVGVEAGLCGNLVINNRSLMMMQEVHGGWPKDFEFGSYHNMLNMDDMDTYCSQIAVLVTNYMALNDIVMHRTFLRQTYNWNNLYYNYYLPVMNFGKTLSTEGELINIKR